MHTILLAVGVTLLTAGAPVQQAQPVQLDSTPPINVTFVDSTLEDALGFLARHSGVTIEIDQSVTEEMRRAPAYRSTVRLNNASLEDVVAALTRAKGLSYSVTASRMIRVFKA